MGAFCLCHAAGKGFDREAGWLGGEGRREFGHEWCGCGLWYWCGGSRPDWRFPGGRLFFRRGSGVRRSGGTAQKANFVLKGGDAGAQLIHEPSSPP
jgi:hypothetical protein